MKRLAVDLRCLPRDGSPGAGIAHAGRELWSALVNRAPNFDTDVHAYIVGRARLPEGARQITRLVTARSLELIRRLQNDPPRGFFSVSGAIPLGVAVPTFPWVHDVAIFYHPEWFPQSWLQRRFTTHLFARGLKRAQHVFCVSETTKQAVLDQWNLSKDRISVSGEGVIYPENAAGYRERENKAVIIGSVEPRKNILFLADLWPEICRRLDRPLKLIIAGRDGWGNVVIPAMEGVERITELNDAERLRLLETAKVTLVPSFYEGFGRVALEAMAHGCPLIASRVGGHVEVVGKAGKLLEPHDREGWIAAIMDLVTQPKVWEKAHILGRERARLFSWEQAADHILALVNKNW